MLGSFATNFEFDENIVWNLDITEASYLENYSAIAHDFINLTDQKNNLFIFNISFISYTHLQFSQLFKTLFLNYVPVYFRKITALRIKKVEREKERNA